jgi:serine/threonine-protein kinase
MNELAGYSLGGYELEEEVGRGSMGVVYRGKQIALGREVAIKILPHSLAKDASYIARFIREAQIIAGLNHPNIVQIYDAGQQNRLLYFVMEFIQGPTLASLLLMDGIIPQHLAAEYAAQIADALDAAYRERFVIHRDIKPENLMLNRWGKIKVMDFGLARATGHRTITIAKSLVGSIYYSSPEQIRGQTLDNRSDIFALGIVLYEMVSGRRPFNGRTMTELSQAIISGRIQPPSRHNPELSSQLECIILKALSCNREQRYEDASLMARELRALNLQPATLPTAPHSSFLPTGQNAPSNAGHYQPTTEEDEHPSFPGHPQMQRPLYPERNLDQASATEGKTNGQSGNHLNGFPHSDGPVYLAGQESVEGRERQLQQVSLSQQATFSQVSEELQAPDRQTVRDHIQRFFRIPARKTSQSATGTDKESATGA